MPYLEVEVRKVIFTYIKNAVRQFGHSTDLDSAVRNLYAFAYDWVKEEYIKLTGDQMEIIERDYFKIDRINHKPEKMTLYYQNGATVEFDFISEVKVVGVTFNGLEKIVEYSNGEKEITNY